MYQQKKQYSFEEVLSKLMRYCSYQERSELEVKKKAAELGANEEDVNALIQTLVDEEFLNEGRFAELYVRGKVSIKRWGKYKLIEGLRSKGVGSAAIQSALKIIDDEIYIANLKTLIGLRGISAKADRNELAKHYRYLVGKGYEPAMITAVFKDKGLI